MKNSGLVNGQFSGAGYRSAFQRTDSAMPAHVLKYFQRLFLPYEILVSHFATLRSVLERLVQNIIFVQCVLVSAVKIVYVHRIFRIKKDIS